MFDIIPRYKITSHINHCAKAQTPVNSTPPVWSRIPGSTCLITNSRIHLSAHEFLDPPTESADRVHTLRRIPIMRIDHPSAGTFCACIIQIFY